MKILVHKGPNFYLVNVLRKKLAGSRWLGSGECITANRRARPEVQDYRAGGQAGCPHDAFLVKPLDVQQMLDTIKSQTQIEWIYEVPAGEAVEASPHVNAARD
jgi:hypothetical protein